MSQAISELPVGTLTFLFTDIEGSTRLWEQQPDAMRLSLQRHDYLMRAAIETNNGQVFKTIGDAFCAVFATTTDALNAALTAQDHLAAATPSATGLLLRPRMALHTGAAEKRNADYFGPTLNRVARLVAVGHGGQILLSEATAGLLRNALPNTVTLRDLGQHSLKDLARPERIYQVVRADVPSDFPPLRSLHASVYNLPQQLNAFIGREQEMGVWLEQLRLPGQRLFTLTGFGGVGKTRVAMALAERSLPYFSDGIWWCEQELSRTVAEMRQRLAEQLKLSLQPDRSVEEQIHHFLRERSLLLVLDNLEQVPDAAQTVREILQAAPGIKVLVTSRRALDLRGETLLELNPLPLDDAVALFVERAQALKPDFALNAENTADVQALCRRLEGVPLALELAAARCIGMTPRQIGQRLSERFRLLQSRSPDLSPRQRALRSAIDWSYCLLGDEEKRIFAQLSVFAGSFTLEDAEAVCDGWDVLESVLELRRHSFFRTETDAETQQARFLMLESLREYAAEQLLEADDESRAVPERHAEYFLRLAREQITKFRTAEETQAVRLLEQQGGNLNEALAWARQAGRHAMQAELARLIGHRLYRRGFLSAAIETVQGGLTAILPLQMQYPGLAAELLRERAGLHLDYGETAEARRLALAALALSTEQGDAAAQARAENLLGQAAMSKNAKDYAAARSHYSRALECAQRAGDSGVMAGIYNNMGLVELRDVTGDAEEISLRREAAAQHLQTALKLCRTAKDRRGQAEALTNLGVLAFYGKRWEQAWNCYAEALVIEQELQDMLQIGLALFNLGEAAHEMRDFKRAVPLLSAAERMLGAEQFPYLSEVTQKLDEAAQIAGLTLETGMQRGNALQVLSIDEIIDLVLSAKPTHGSISS
jgi:predicted ATPase/class 3 adenylate cyclase